MAEKPTFKLTYATMFTPPEELHTRFEAALTEVKSGLGASFNMLINGEERQADETFADGTPINQNLTLGHFQKGDASHANDAIKAARAAFSSWSARPWQERVKLLHQAADLIDERIFTFAAVIALEVGKNRMEALGDAAEAADLIRYACNQVAANDGFVEKMGEDPLVGYQAINYSILKPHGVWLIISPFNFPAALTAGPAGAALAAGNTVVIKPASSTPWTSRLLVECFRDAGIPAGVVNYATGPGATLGEALISSPEVDGITFTGSFDVGMHIHRQFAAGEYPRPVILEMGGKNPAIVSRDADIEEAALGIVRSAFGLQGQKCSACSRVYVERPAYKLLMDRMIELSRKIKIGDPTERDVYLGPVINRSSYENFQKFVKDMKDANARVLQGGRVLTDAAFADGFFCEPTLAVDLPLSHPLWKQEMFLPITALRMVENLDQAFRLANDVKYGLTAGFYGAPEETQQFFNTIQAGVTYANRPQGATTGAWRGYQPFGGWKGSGSSGKNAGGLYYVPLYAREQVQTLIKKTQ